jgi:RNA polymerase sigma-70 factor (ECF subfamily)
MDICQQTFIKLHRNMNQYDKKHRFSSWLFAIAANCIRNYRRDSARANMALKNLSLINPGHAPDHAETFYKDQVLDRLNAHISALHADLKIPLVLHMIEDVAVEEIARICKISGRSVRKRIEKAKLILKNQMEGYAHE